MAYRPAYDLTDEKETQEYLRDIEIEYSYQCLHEKDVEGCDRLAEFQSVIRQNYEYAASLYKDNCDKNNHPKDCSKYGEFLATGKGVPKVDFKAAVPYFQKSCDLNYARGCFGAGEAGSLALKDEKEPKYDQVISNYRKGCDLKDGDSCFSLSRLYLFGRPGLPKDLPKAFEMAKKGCELNHLHSCNHLTLNYKHGHGTEKNLALAEETREKAYKLSDEYLSKHARHVSVNE